ncbi:tetratricopeptide repeat protein [Rhizobacter sp. Root404]|uniref:tetratricopeptide repeat protein n=1 Tax=Rhizobacter sp. Root404 TaxID=1736528 RepID=UPI0007023C54|nr:tetratricopeptide repeat protein [Rhizobacter sp. Root404]KQW35505.1 hypothetical protein ASC76_21070 [Rhizobacter sp. Root404]
MKFVVAALISMFLVGCAAPLPLPPSADLLRDELFVPPSTPVDAGQAMAVSPEMRRYLDERIVGVSHFGDHKRRLVEMLYNRDELRLEYDAVQTRTASQAFAARAGNCLSLVMMTGALARELGVNVRYQLVLGNELWDRSTGLYISVGHVNLTLADRPPQFLGAFMRNELPLTIDFLPPRDGHAPRTRAIEEHTVVAMFLNNRAVESLVAGRTDDAYWWVREALRIDPQLVDAYITLGVVYRNRGLTESAEQVLRRASVREPDNTKILANRVLVLRDMGRDAEATALAQTLARLESVPPFRYFYDGMAALRAGRPEAARDLFSKEVARAPYHAEFHFWLAVSYAELNDPGHAAKYLARAMEVSTTRRDHDLYASKLARLKALHVQ